MHKMYLKVKFTFALDKPARISQNINMITAATTKESYII